MSEPPPPGEHPRAATPNDDLFAQVMNLLIRAEAAAALGAELARTLEGAAVPPEIAPQLARLSALAAPALASAAPELRRAVLGAIRAFFRQAAERRHAPGAPRCAW
jgi:hypothetical protein